MMPRRIVVLTGAGISRESGLATFRDADGLWAKVRIENVATPGAFARDPARVQGFYNARRAQLRDPAIAPNAAHLALARLEREHPGEVLLVTQNVDDLHERAGSPQVAHLHGTLFATRCYDGSCTYRQDPDRTPYDEPPHCPLCGSWLRPDVVLFGEPLDADAQWVAKRAVRDCDLLLAVGTSGEVSTAASLIRYAVDVGALLVTIDPAPEVPPAFDVHVPMPAETVLPALLD
jgi:NAD-dependent deacetylase